MRGEGLRAYNCLPKRAVRDRIAGGIDAHDVVAEVEDAGIAYELRGYFGWTGRYAAPIWGAPEDSAVTSIS
jgi:hypothetical protein